MKTETLSEKRARAARSRTTFSGGPGGYRGGGRPATCACGVCKKCKRRAKYVGRVA